MSTQSDEIINKIEEVRRENNKNWMQLLRIAFHHAPREAAAVMAQIGICDLRINGLTRELSELEAEKE